MTISDVVIKFDELILSDYFDLLEEPDMGLFAPVTNELVRAARGYGSKLKDSYSGSNTINLSVFSTEGNLRKFKDDLSIIARDKKLHKLSFSYEPDRYYLCKLDGDSKLIRSLENKDECTGTLSFIVPEGISHGTEEKFFTKNETNSLITINNGGTYKTSPTFEIDFTENTDYVALITGDEVIQLGTVEDDDVNKPQLIDILFSDEMGFSTNNKWSQNVARIRHTPENANLSGSVQWRADDVLMTDYGNGEGYHGGSITRYLTDDTVENWEFTFRVGFSTNSAAKRVSQIGLTEGNILDKDNNFIAGFNLKKPNKADERVFYAWYIGDTRVFSGEIPYRYRNFFGNITIKKIGNKFYFSIGGFGDNWKFDWQYSRSFINDDVANLRFKSISIYMAAYGSNPTMHQRVSYTKAIKIGTTDISEVPLTFLTGDHLEITEKLKVFLNGTPADDYLANGSKKIYLEPGVSDILVASDKAPEVVAKVRPKFL
ncbi:distal tail protein Dit [Vagococcus fluvialis]|uniref:distal tail protein Dit n=1 Tax=Vagococcus fluvialis TaxID=2738 RepID=UPI0037B09BA2